LKPILYIAKPYPDGLLHCCQTIKVDPCRSIYIGDSPSDGQAATAAGMKSIGVTWGSHSIDKLIPTFTCIAYSISELNNYILQFLSDMDDNDNNLK